MRRFIPIASVILLFQSAVQAQTALPEPTLQPPFQTVDLNIGDSQEVMLAGKKVVVKLRALREQSDSLRNAVRRAEVDVEVAGKTLTLVSANYRLPVKIGDLLQIDCPITRGYTLNSTRASAGQAPWGLAVDQSGKL